MFTTDTIKVMLLASVTTTGLQNGAQFLSDVTSTYSGVEATGGGNTGYTAGGATLAGKTDTTTSNVTTLTATSPVWTTVNPGTLVAAYAVWYKSTGTASTSPVLCYWDLGGTQTASNGGSFTLTVSGSGLITLTAS